MWCGIRPDDPFGGINTDPTRPPSSASDIVLAETAGVTDGGKIDVITMAKIYMSSSKSPSAMSATLLLYADAIQDLHQGCVAADSTVYGSKCSNWINKVLALKPRTPDDRKFCRSMVAAGKDIKNIKDADLARCDCWSMLLGEVAPDWLLVRCGLYPAAHVVQLVGWGEQKSADGSVTTTYWMLQNQWGPAWGDKGFFKLEQRVNMWGVEDELYLIRPQKDDVKAGLTNAIASEESSETWTRRERGTRRLVGGWVQSHHPSSPHAQAALEHLGNEFIGPSRTGSIDEHSHRHHRLVKVESAEMQVVAGVNHRFHVVSQALPSGNKSGGGGGYHCHRVTVHRRLDGSHSLLHVEHVEELSHESM